MHFIGKITKPPNKIPDRLGLLLVIALQSLIICLVFPHIIFRGNEYVFNNQYDGVKNYFTLQGYVQQKAEGEFLKFRLMNHPYGDYIFYTDNTPLLAAPIKVILNHLFYQPGAAIYLFNLLMLLGILLSSMILYRLLYLYSLSGLALIFFSIALPWLCPQVLRLGGHFNLTLSFILLGVIYLLSVRSVKNPLACDLTLSFVMLLSGSIHLYYLLLSLVFVFSYFFIHAMNEAIHKRAWFSAILRGVLVCGAALGLFFLQIQLVDHYYDLRKSSAEGYDFLDWKLQWRAIFTPYFFHPISQILRPDPLPYESFGYLGTGTLIGISGIVAYLPALFRNSTSTLSSVLSNRKFKTLSLLFGASVVGLLIALGHQVKIADNVFINNYLNPFFYLKQFVPQITHFRCLGRFSWFFFWMANLCSIIFIYFLAERRYRFKMLLWAMVAGYLFDMLFALKHLSSDYKADNPFRKEILNEVSNSMKIIDANSYQALLAFPFYHVGSEDYNYTIDPADAHCVKTMQMSLASGLPLINSKMSRTPLQHTYNIFSLFEAHPDESLLQQLSATPVLVYLDKSFYASDSLFLNEIPPVSRMPARKVAMEGHLIIEKFKMKKIHEDEKAIWYEWKDSVDNQ